VATEHEASERVGWSWALVRPALAVLALALLAMAVLGQLVRTRDLAVQETAIRHRLDATAARLQALVASGFAVTASLETLLRVNGRIEAADLDRALAARAGDPLPLHNIGVAPDNVIVLVHPLAGNERALGLDYRSVPSQWAQVERARALRQTLLFAPVHLQQGGRAVVQRRPIFLPTSDGGERYWGTLSAVVHLDRFVDQAGLAREPLQLALFGRRADGVAGDLIWGEARLRTERHLSREVPLAGGGWVLHAQPAQGWAWQQAFGIWFWLGGSACAVVVLLTLGLTRRRLQLEQRSRALEAEVDARRASQLQAEAANAKLQVLLRTASDWYWEQDDALRVTAISVADDQPIAVPVKTALGIRRWENPRLIPGLPSDAAWAAHRAQCERRESYRNFEYALRGDSDDDGAGGVQRWISVSGDPSFDAQGRFTGYRGTGRDVTELHEARERLGAAQAQLDSLLDAPVQTAVIALDLQGRVVLFNRGAELMLGWRAEEMMGKPPLRLHRRDETEARCAELARALGRPINLLDFFAHHARHPLASPLIWTYRHKDGRELTVSQSPSVLRDAQGSVVGYLGMAVDISAQQAAQRLLTEARDRLQAVLDGAQEVGIVVSDPHGRIDIFNRGAERLFGYALHEVLGRSTLMLQDRQELDRRRLALSEERGQPMRLRDVTRSLMTHATSWSLVRKGGERFPALLRLSELKDREGQLQGHLSVVLDISLQVQAQAALEQLNRELEQRVQARGAELTRTLSTLSQAQEELLRSERLAALGALVAGVAHELNTPLGTCMTAASSLHDRTRELQAMLQGAQLRRSALEGYAQDTAAMADLLLRALRNATELVAHFKQLSVDQTSDQRRPFRMATVVDDVLSVMRPQLKHSPLRIRTDIELDVPLDGYPGELGRLLTNLIQNAQLHAFAPEQVGLLHIEARPLDDSHFLLVVSDDGQGMSAEVRRRAFDPFFTTKLGQGGSGLGLNIVFNIATGVLGGEVSLHSEPGQGTRFEFRLPYLAPQRVKPGADMQI
jgi:PAS domain S-box-containing protein